MSESKYKCLCGGTNVFTMEIGNRAGLYCGVCMRLLKYLTKDELREAEKYIDEMEDEENEEYKRMSNIREYRGRRLDNGEWCFGDLVRSWIEIDSIFKRKDNGRLRYEIKWQFVDEDGERWNEHEEVDPNTVGQFVCIIGEVEIFDGDIIKATNKRNNHVAIGKVYFEDCTWYGAMDYMSYVIDNCNVEVIGNIWEGQDD